eukprot:3664662-Rhodomonas_salina.2
MGQLARVNIGHRRVDLVQQARHSMLCDADLRALVLLLRSLDLRHLARVHSAILVRARNRLCVTVVSHISA